MITASLLSSHPPPHPLPDRPFQTFPMLIFPWDSIKKSNVLVAVEKCLGVIHLLISEAMKRYAGEERKAEMNTNRDKGKF